MSKLSLFGAKCRLCRREGSKLFLKGERCYTPKCAIVKRNFPPGVHGATGHSRPTEYGLELREKQKAKRIYGLLETQFKNYYKKAIKKTGNTGEIIYQSLETRLDNVVYRLGFAKSRSEARQLVNHGHILINGKKNDIPSAQVRVNDIIGIKDSAKAKSPFKNLSETLKKHKPLSWLSLDAAKPEGKILTLPNREDLKEVNMKLIVELYSK